MRPPASSAAAGRASACPRATETSTCVACRNGLAASSSCIQTDEPWHNGSTAMTLATPTAPGLVEALIHERVSVLPAPKKYPDEVKDRAIRLVQDLLSDPEVAISVTGACNKVGQQLGINRDTLREWTKQAQIDAGFRPGLSSDDRRRLKELEGRTVSCGALTRS